MRIAMVKQFSLFSDFDISLFKAGKHFRLYEKLGSHSVEVDGVWGYVFAVWAPNAKAVSVIGNFNGWNHATHALMPRWDGSGVWEGFIPDIKKGELYKYAIHARDGRRLEKTDPFAKFCEIPPNTASITWDEYYDWQDWQWMDNRKNINGLDKPFSVYEVHLGSWKKKEGGLASLTYRELATELVDYVKEMGFTHVELLPVMEHPYFPSWGYQITGYFAPTSRFGLPEDFKFLVDSLHQAGIGLILDWVPSHFPNDAHGLADFDGTHLYDHADPRQGFHPDWKSCIFNYGRNEVRSFLISNALYWLDKYHIDGLRVDAVASMLYLDYSRKEGEWIPNRFGGNENLEAIAFLREFNETVYTNFPDTITIAEESTAWSGVSRPVHAGGLGFGQKWMMGWMHDTLNYFKNDPINRKYHHNAITFSIVYAFTENFMLPLSHDEVVHGKGPLIDRMPGDPWQRMANMRLLYGYMFTHPGTKLLFMGGEIGQTTEWSIERGIEWGLLSQAPHQQLQAWVKQLNVFYRSQAALFGQQFIHGGFSWIDLGDWTNSVLSYVRRGADTNDFLIVVCNFTPVVRYGYRIGLPEEGMYTEILNSDDAIFGGSGISNGKDPLPSQPVFCHNQNQSLEFTLPPLAVVVFQKTGALQKVKKTAKSTAKSSRKKDTTAADNA